MSDSRRRSSLAIRRDSSPVFRVATTVGPVVGGALIVLALVLSVSAAVQAVLIAVGGLLLGLITLRLAALGPQPPDPDSLQREVERDAAYYLGYAVSNLSLLPWPAGPYLALVDLPRIELRLPFSDDEQALLKSASGERDPNAVRAVADMLLNKARDNLSSSLWPFFELGGATTQLYEQADKWLFTQQALAHMKHLQENSFIRLDSRYASVVDEIVQLLTKNGPTVTDEQRPDLHRRLLEALGKFPTDTLDKRNMTVPLPVTDWYWVTEGAMRFIGDDYSVVARDKDSYEVSGTDGSDSTASVTRDDAGRHCSLHPDADERHPCMELDLVLHVTDGGKPVTTAKLVPVRHG